MPAKLLLTLLLVAPSISNALETFRSDVYLFSGTFQGISKSLEEALAEDIAVKCKAGRYSLVEGITINFKRGPLAGVGPLDTVVITKSGKPTLRFPGHPYAEITASYECLR